MIIPKNEVPDVTMIAISLRMLIKRLHEQSHHETSDLEERIAINQYKQGLSETYLYLIQRFPELHDDSLDGYLLAQLLTKRYGVDHK